MKSLKRLHFAKMNGILSKHQNRFGDWRMNRKIWSMANPADSVRLRSSSRCMRSTTKWTILLHKLKRQLDQELSAKASSGRESVIIRMCKSWADMRSSTRRWLAHDLIWIPDYSSTSYSISPTENIRRETIRLITRDLLTSYQLSWLAGFRNPAEPTPKLSLG